MSPMTQTDFFRYSSLLIGLEKQQRTTQVPWPSIASEFPAEPKTQGLCRWAWWGGDSLGKNGGSCCLFGDVVQKSTLEAKK